VQANLKKWIKDVNVGTPMTIGPGQSKIVYEPLGVVLILGSWNFPLFTTIGPLVSVIAAGNCAVIKGSEATPNTSRAMGLLTERYLENTSFIYVEGAVQVAIALTSKTFDSIVYTGSSQKGKLVAAAAA
jgi:aldehyde dehydrogenase (NAD+)